MSSYVRFYGWMTIAIVMLLAIYNLQLYRNEPIDYGIQDILPGRSFEVTTIMSVAENNGSMQFKYYNNMSFYQASRRDLLAMLHFHTPTNCYDVINGSILAISEARKITKIHHIADRDYADLTSNCSVYRSRGFILSPINKEEAEYPIAFSIQIYKQMAQVEKLLMAIYRPQNVYCINVDQTSSESIHASIRGIAGCFHNIVITTVDVQYGTFSQVEADLACMRVLMAGNCRWKYLLTLAGQMYPIKTNLEIVQILKAMNGSNVMVGSHNNRVVQREYGAGKRPINITVTKGGCSFAVTRSFVDFILHDERVALFRMWANKTRYPDEMFFQSLNHSPQLGVPGAYTGEPEYVNGYTAVVRHAVWANKQHKCHGLFIRSVCIFGVGDLPALTKRPEMFVNKLYQDFQPMTFQCLEEWFMNQTRDDILGVSRLQLDWYRALPNVKHHLPSGLEIA